MIDIDTVKLVKLDRYNWENLLSITLLPEQESFLPPILYSLAQSRFESLTPLGISLGPDLVGMVMYGRFSGICWINRIMVDQHFQGQGIGRKALQLLLEQLRTDPACAEIRTSYHISNKWADHLFGKEGFKAISQPVNGEIVAVYPGTKD